LVVPFEVGSNNDAGAAPDCREITAVPLSSHAPVHW
jgi:hypothetical protein